MGEDWDEINEERVREWQARLAGILPELRGHGALWHRTSIRSLKTILKHGAIEPNDGRFPDSYPQSKNCYARHIGAVSLFDFDLHPLREILLHAFKWAQFLTDSGRHTAVIKIDRRRLEGKKLIFPGQVGVDEMRIVREDGRRYIPAYIPRVEAWYMAPVPTKAFLEILLIEKPAGYSYRKVSIADFSAMKIMPKKQIAAPEFGGETS